MSKHSVDWNNGREVARQDIRIGANFAIKHKRLPTSGDKVNCSDPDVILGATIVLDVLDALDPLRYRKSESFIKLFNEMTGFVQNYEQNFSSKTIKLTVSVVCRDKNKDCCILVSGEDAKTETLNTFLEHECTSVLQAQKYIELIESLSEKKLPLYLVSKIRDNNLYIEVRDNNWVGDKREFSNVCELTEYYLRQTRNALPPA